MIQWVLVHEYWKAEFYAQLCQMWLILCALAPDTNLQKDSKKQK